MSRPSPLALDITHDSPEVSDASGAALSPRAGSPPSPLVLASGHVPAPPSAFARSAPARTPRAGSPAVASPTFIAPLGLGAGAAGRKALAAPASPATFWGAAKDPRLFEQVPGGESPPAREWPAPRTPAARPLLHAQVVRAEREKCARGFPVSSSTLCSFALMESARRIAAGAVDRLLREPGGAVRVRVGPEGLPAPAARGAAMSPAEGLQRLREEVADLLAERGYSVVEEARALVVSAGPCDS